MVVILLPYILRKINAKRPAHFFRICHHKKCSGMHRNHGLESGTYAHVFLFWFSLYVEELL